jgi:hypothetical protein
MNVREVLFGNVIKWDQGVPVYLEFARTSEIAKKHLAMLKERRIIAGILEPGNLGEKWADEEIIAAKMKQLDDFVAAGYKAFSFDFFGTGDTFAHHRNIAAYFRVAHDRLDYTECHLGMVTYGPQFQRLVILNHPTDIGGFDVTRFSPDWITFLAFRQSRREWQKLYQSLMPEYGLLYLLTHYANTPHPRRYTDPEPQQFLYGPPCYYNFFNFHDAYGYREALAAKAAFTPFYIFGHLELKMPERDIIFTHEFLRWVRDNARMLRPSRVCLEDDEACVVSKLSGNRGAIFLLNYGSSARRFSLKLAVGTADELRIRQVYPERKQPFKLRDGSTLEVDVRGESSAILEVNDAFNGLPPENPSAFPLDITGWKPCAGGYEASFIMPDVKSRLVKHKDPNLPVKVSSLDQQGKTELWGLGRLPESFLKVYDFRDGCADTWKFAPSAYADKVWLVYRPAIPILMEQKLPVATVNGTTVPLVPRVDYRSEKDASKWICPLFFADITDVLKYGADNTVVIMGGDQKAPKSCHIFSVADCPLTHGKMLPKEM